ncbi:MAG: class I SAM-dependent methyltransferase [Anaerolineales bacterium]|nr:class I SAM-dependent methyltransferase [Anaerolineales bacterium]
MNRPAQELLLEVFSPQPADRVVLLESGAGWLASAVAHRVPQGQVLALNRDVRLAWQAQEALQNRPNITVSLTALPAQDGFDHVLLTIPKERRYARSLLVAAWQALKPGGQLLLAGPGGSGAKAVITDAGRLFGQVTTLAYRARQRVAAARRGPQLPQPLPEAFCQPGVAPGSRHNLQLDLPQGKLVCETHPGIFSWQELDEGSALLLQHLQIETGARVWDVGCGYGVLGLAAARAGAGQVWLSDINLIAVDYTQRNARQNGLTDKVMIFPADALEIRSTGDRQPEAFDLILSNPAFHQGREVDRSMADDLIRQAGARLAPDGRLLLVANRFLNYERTMGQHFQHVTRVAETGKFHLLSASNPT